MNLSNRRHLKIDVALSSLVARHGAPIYTEKLLSDYNNISSNKSTINSSPLSSIFIDNQSIGFYCFPQSIKGYILPKEELTGLPYPDPGSSEAIDYLFSTFKSAEFWDRFLGFVSQESNREVEEINATLIKMYKSILSYFQTPIIDVVKSHIISMAAAYSKKNLQRCACELITGLVAGSKHWPQSRITEMWVWLEPVLKQVFLNAPPEMLVRQIDLILFMLAILMNGLEFFLDILGGFHTFELRK